MRQNPQKTVQRIAVRLIERDDAVYEILIGVQKAKNESGAMRPMACVIDRD
jgi:hypothetical protein